MGKSTYTDFEEDDIVTYSNAKKLDRLKPLKNMMKKAGTGITALFRGLFIPAVIAGALIAGSVLMFAGVLAPFALGILTNVMIALSLAVVAYSAVNYVMNKFVNFLTNKLHIGLRSSTASILSNVVSLSAAGAVLGTGIGLAATGAWVPVVLPLALSIAVVALAAFSVGWLTRAFFKTMANTDFEPSMKLQERTVWYKPETNYAYYNDDVSDYSSSNQNKHQILPDDDNSNDDSSDFTRTNPTSTRFTQF